MEPVGMAPRRLAEQAYVDLLDASPWSRRLAARLEAALPFAAREGALALALRAASEPSPMDAAHVLQCLAVPPEAAEQAVAALAALGLVEPAGTRLRGPQWRALADWAWLRLEQGRQGGDPAAPRLALLARLMTESSDPETASAPGAAGSARRLLTEILARLAGQELPEALFHYHDFYEAVGRLDPPRRREAMLRATRRLRAPESLGVATGMAGEPWPLFHARVFRDGLYRAANEELWVAVDLSATRSLTTAEIQQALQIAKNEGRRLGAVACHPWLIVGQAASADAMEMLRREDIDCSNLEQLALLHDLLVEPAARRAPGAMEAPEDCQAPMSCPAPPSEPDAGHPGAVIDLPAQAAAPQAEVSSLRLPARDQSEYIAASMAEKVAIRAGFSPTDAGKIKTSVLEGVLNAIEHSRNPEKLIDIQFRLSPEALEAWIENEGAPFVPGQDAFRPDPRAKLSAANKRGWGITLMRKFMDVASYEPCPGGTRLRLVKRRAAAPEAIESPSSAAIAAGAPSAPVAQEHSSLARHRKDKAQP
jgi:anti-sigma regulatory factor (Ser/Thr protein kinase)